MLITVKNPATYRNEYFSKRVWAGKRSLAKEEVNGEVSKEETTLVSLESKYR